jgi:hypothetical protein
VSGAVATASLTETERLAISWSSVHSNVRSINTPQITVGQGEIQNFSVQSGSLSGVEAPGSVA